MDRTELLHSGYKGMAGESGPPHDCESVVERFREDGALVAELARDCERFRALCEEHALTTEAVDRRKRIDEVNDPAFFDYLEILRDLEREIATALANEKRSLRRTVVDVARAKRTSPP